jgi:G patch domain/KOW motif-containing protein
LTSNPDSSSLSDKATYDKYQKETNGDAKKEKPSTSNQESDDEIQFLDSKPAPAWAAPDLIVRVISKSYKDGRYYKQKMLVVDVAGRDHIELKDDRGRIHSKF